MGLTFNETIRIDNETYRVAGEVSFQEGSGEDAIQWTFYALKHAESDVCMYLEHDNGYHLLRAREHLDPLPDDRLHISLERYPNEIEDVAFGVFTADRNPKLAWGYVDNPAVLGDVPEMFAGTRDVMIYRADDEQPVTTVFLSQQLIAERDDEVFYSARFPAAHIERTQVERKQVPVGWLPFNYGLMVIVTLLASMAMSRPNIDVVSTFWIVGAVSIVGRLMGRTMRFYPTLHLVSSALMAWVCTRVLYNLLLGQGVIHDLVAFEAGHIAAILALLTALRIGTRRLYFVVTEAALTAGWLSLGIYTIGVLLMSFIDEYWWGQWYNWYLGASFWGYIWVLLLLVFLIYLYKDYNNVPLSFRAFQSQVDKLRGALDEGADTLARSARGIKDIADDLADAVKISDDPQVASLFKYELPLRQVTTALERVADSGLPLDCDHQRLSEDLAILSADLEYLTTPMDATPGQSLRISPMLRVERHD